MSSDTSSIPPSDLERSSGSAAAAENEGTPVTPDWDSPPPRTNGDEPQRDGATRNERRMRGGEALRNAPRGRTGWTGTTEGRSLSTWLGVFSVALGAAELLAPRGVSRAIGLKSSAATTGVIQAMGLREIAAGAGLLSHPESKEWMAARVGGDVIDLAFLGYALVKSERPLRTLLAAATVLGVGALDLLGTEKLAEARKAPTRSREGSALRSNVLRSITIGCSRAEAYAQWRDFTSFPRFMEGIEAVELLADGRSHWRARGPAGTSVEWDSEVVADERDELFAWRSVESAAIYHNGTVRFADAPNGLGTVVTVEMSYAPPGGKIAAALLKLFRKEPGQQIGDDLRRFKQLLETGEVLLSDASSGKTPRHALPSPSNSIH
jgi:uncharacterized membrane protein